MSDVNISLGTTLGVVVGEPATYDDTGFEALTFQDVGEISSFPEMGGEAEVATHTPVKSGVVAKRAGSRDYGSVVFPMAHVFGEAGQDELQSGFDGTNAGKVYSIKVDNPTIGALFFTAVITSFKFTPGDANSIAQASAGLALTNKVIAKAAA